MPGKRAQPFLDFSGIGSPLGFGVPSTQNLDQGWFGRPTQAGAGITVSATGSNVKVRQRHLLKCHLIDICAQQSTLA